MTVRIALLTLLIASVHATAAMAEQSVCTDLIPGRDGTASVTAPVPRIWPLCFTIATTPGHVVDLSITKADEMRMSVYETRPDRADERSIIAGAQSASLTPKVESYHVLVDSRLLPNDTDRTFTFRVEWK